MIYESVSIVRLLGIFFGVSVVTNYLIRMQERQKIGIVLNQAQPLAWEYALIKQIQDAQLLDVAGIFYVDEKVETTTFDIWQWHLKIDATYFKPQPNAFDKVTDMPSMDAIPKVVLENNTTLKTQTLDFILWLSDEAFPDQIEQAVSKGILYFTHGANHDNSQAFLGYWEFIKKQEVITSTLLFRDTSQQRSKAIYQTWSMMPSMSISRSKNEHAWKLVSLAFRAVKTLSEEGTAALLATSEASIKNTRPAINDARPSFLQGAMNLAKHFNRLAHKAMRKLAYREQWILLLDGGQRASTSFKNFKKIMPPKDRFWADPFLIEKQGRQYLFFEELPFATDKGHLSVMEILADGTLSQPKTILEKPYHLSYPFIFEWENTFYMIPESYQDQSIQLYECQAFPDQWQHKMNLMTGVSAFDTTLLFYDKKWWLFTVLTEQKGGGHNDELFLFFADTPFTTEWKAHPQNPIVSDVRLARPAGNIYEENGKLIRPSQDCARKYGFGFNLNEIEVLSETEYREKRILNIRPNWDTKLTRTHSFNHSKDMTVIDAVMQRSRFF